MQFFSTLVSLAVLTSGAFATDVSLPGTGITSPPTGTCYTITQTNPPACAASVSLPDSCVTELCLQLSTITLSCGCESIYTTQACYSTCPPLKCGVSYATVHIPCPTSPPYSYTNKTITVTTTDITTLSTCPAKETCSGQQTTWSGNQGPFSCTKKPSCTAQLPGDGTTTITGTTVVSKTGPTPTGSTGPTQLPAGGGGRVEVVSGGLLAVMLSALALL